MSINPQLEAVQEHQGIEKLLQTIAALRHPEQGCPWDLKQTHATLKPYMLEEAYEAVEAMNDWESTGKSDSLKEELGDVLLQVVLHCQLAKEAKQFDFEAVCEGIAEKLIRRHPHVFGDVTVENSQQVTQNWEAIKQAEKGGVKQESVLTGISKSQPALSQALQTSKKAVKVGFEWPSLDSLWDCVMSEYDEFKAEMEGVANPSEISAAQFARLENEMGDIFFASVNLARHFGIDPEVALNKATQKFTRRFQAMEQLIQQRHLKPQQSLDEAMKGLDFETWDVLWREAKDLTE